MTINELQKFTKALDMLRDFATDEQAVAAMAAYPEWKADVEYKAGKRVVFGGDLYKVLKDHTSEEQVTPVMNDVLYKKI